ncbi:MAG: iron-containing alcohol dehydrogenase [Sneathiellales bacterium]|nr:iron-containing alcohol dehydrogenase [Sneathiellales bacterium]
MSNFTFNTTPKILCEPGAVAAIGTMLKNRNFQSVFLVTDPGIIKAGLLENAVKSLKAADIKVDIYDQVEADPRDSIVLAASDQARIADADVVIGLGGGSSLDVAKLVALLAKGDERLEDVYGIEMVKGGRLPLYLIPTTAGTGSEVTPISIITVGAETKKGVVSSILLPDMAILDADLTLGLPSAVTAATGIDAMVHAIEAYTSKGINNNPISQTLAKEALRLLGANIRTAVFKGSDREARSNMLLGSCLAGQAFANSPVAAVHALAYPIGGIFHVPHGLSNALVLPEVMRFNAEICFEQYADLAPIVFPDIDTSKGPKQTSETFIEQMAELCEELDLQTRLSEVGIKAEDLDKLAKAAMEQTRLLVNNPREVTENDAFKIYKNTL